MAEKRVDKFNRPKKKKPDYCICRNCNRSDNNCFIDIFYLF